MDVFVEQLVKKKKTPGDMAIISVTIWLGLLIMVLTFMYLFPLTALVVCGVGYLMFRIVTSQNVEFEYSVTNGDIDIDCIRGKRTRKRIVSVRGAKIESLEHRSPTAEERKRYDRLVMAAALDHSDDNWCFTYHSKKSGHTLVIFQPDDRILEALTAGLPRHVIR
jgi:hypothetical protein